MTDGVRETLGGFLGPQPGLVLEVGPGTARLQPSPYEGRSAKALAERCVIRCVAEALPFGGAIFDRVFCIDTLHHLTDRQKFFAEARRVLKPGGGLMTIGMDPHADRDELSDEYLAETGAIDRERFARVRTLRGEMALAGFDWTESMEADHVELVQPAADFRLYATIGWAG